jgi:hypothetical protein
MIINGFSHCLAIADLLGSISPLSQVEEMSSEPFTIIKTRDSKIVTWLPRSAVCFCTWPVVHSQNELRFAGNSDAVIGSV